MRALRDIAMLAALVFSCGVVIMTIASPQGELTTRQILGVAQASLFLGFLAWLGIWASLPGRRTPPLSRVEEERRDAFSVGRRGYECPVCGAEDECAYLSCNRPDCTDGRDRYGRTRT